MNFHQGKDSEKWKEEKERLASATLEERREVRKSILRESDML